MCIKRFAFGQCQAGISLVELVLFILIVSIALVGILSVMNVTNKASADPLQRKQALSVAESLLEEIEQQPFTFCDPSDPNASTATSAVIGVNGCQSNVQGLGPTAGQTRYAEPRFNHVADYQGFSMTGIKDINNNPIVGLENYTASVNMTPDGARFGVAANDVLRIDVRVTLGPTDISLSGYRFRYAPRAVP